MRPICRITDLTLKSLMAGVCLLYAPLFAFLLTSCPSSSVPLKSGLGLVETKHTLNTKQKCGRHELMSEVVDQALACLIDAYVASPVLREKGITARMIRDDLRRDQPLFCLVEQPEACGWGPCEEYKQCQRRAGCTHWGSATWVAMYYPPLCSPDWPREPKSSPGGLGCAQSPAEQRETYRQTTMHELAELIQDRFHLGSAHVQWSLDVQRECDPDAVSTAPTRGEQDSK